jgi:hypothetical protein
VSQTPQARVPLVYLDRDRAGQITREWLPYLTAAANAASNGDLTALQAALSALQTEVDSAEAVSASIQAQLNALSIIVAGLLESGDVLMQRSMAQRPQTIQPSDTQALFSARIFGS